MELKAPAYFDSKTVALLRQTLDDAWDSIRPAQQAGMLKTTLAVRILSSAADGERDPERLREAGLVGIERRQRLSSGAWPVIAVTIERRPPT